MAIKKEYADADIRLLAQEIKSLYDMTSTQFTGVNGRLDKINGRVDKHDDLISETLQERRENRQLQKTYFKSIDDLDTRVDDLELAETTHIINCPVNPQLRIVQDTLLSQKAIKTYLASMFVIGIGLGGLVVGVLRLIF